MVTVNLTPGNHTIQWQLAGYNTLTAVINVTASGSVSCVSATNGNCNTSTPPGVITLSTIPAQVTGYLLSSGGTTPPPTTPPPSIPPSSTSLADFISKLGGNTAMKSNLTAMGALTDGFIGMNNLGWTVSLGDMGTATDRFLGL